MTSQQEKGVARDTFLVLLAACRRARRRDVAVIDSTKVLAEIAGNRFLEGFVAPEGVMRELRAAAVKLSAYSDVESAENDTWTIDDEVRREVESTLREASWRATYLATKRQRTAQARSAPPTWHPSVVRSVAAALTEASSVGARYACGTHLLFGLLTDPSGPASVTLRSAGGQPDALVQALHEASGQSVGEPLAPLIALLEASGTVAPTSGPVGLIQRLLDRRQSKRGGYGNSVLYSFEVEILRQAVRADALNVTTADAVLAMVSLDIQLTATGRSLVPALARINSSGAILRQHGLSIPFPTAYLNGPNAEREVLGPDEIIKRFGRYGGPPWGRSVTSALDRVAVMAPGTHLLVGTNHLLVELLNDEENAACHLVRSFGADPSSIRQDLTEALLH